MAPDRRFGLPHPLDADPSEDSSPRKPGLWESFKRALGNPPAGATPGDLPGHPLPAWTPQTAELARSAPPPAPTGTPDRPPPTAGPSDREAIDADVPFLVEEPPVEPISTVRSDSVAERDRTVPAQSSAPETAPVSPESTPEPPDSAPRLARGLDSFSRRNAEREKKFAHLLRDDDAPPDPKPRPRGKRG